MANRVVKRFVLNTKLAAVRKLYLERHANRTYWVDFEDFSFWRIDVVDFYYVDGFGDGLGICLRL